MHWKIVKYRHMAVHVKKLQNIQNKIFNFGSIDYNSNMKFI